MGGGREEEKEQTTEPADPPPPAAASVSLFVDSIPLFAGRTPVQCYADFVAAFASALRPHLGSTVVELQVGLGPAGELRYPAYPLDRWSFCGVGEFQCYSKYALSSLATAAAAAGHPEWGHGGPSDAGSYASTPASAPFFSGGYATEYGRFFLSWYAGALLAHGDAVLGAVRAALGSPANVRLAAKVAGVHWWYKHASHAAELTAGYYNTNGNDGYGAIAAMMARHAVAFDFTCLEMQDSEQRGDCECGPRELVAQARAAAAAHNVRFSGENALARYDSTAYATVEADIRGAASFTYLRLSDTLLQNDNFAEFTSFVRTLANE